ncbi:cation channel sperm-associated protein subunit gamma [Catovirus CTV1]|uniref:Cation channel sperm-associated protein subunit gamma n=1 Tax=Catovirus CTV1 TaxID=1977631 RepID=A0A1V0SBG8_9VIRU|nr:cation channel sperm-associated protein subunit gamma [Catovirus CTV1]
MLPEILSTVFEYLEPVDQLKGKLICKEYYNNPDISINIKRSLEKRVDKRILDFIANKKKFYFYGEYLFDSFYTNKFPQYNDDTLEIYYEYDMNNLHYDTANIFAECEDIQNFLKLCEKVYNTEKIDFGENFKPYWSLQGDYEGIIRYNGDYNPYYNDTYVFELLYTLNNFSISINLVPYNSKNILGNRLIPSYLNFSYDGNNLIIGNPYDCISKNGHLIIPFENIIEDYELNDDSQIRISKNGLLKMYEDFCVVSIIQYINTAYAKYNNFGFRTIVGVNDLKRLITTNEEIIENIDSDKVQENTTIDSDDDSVDEGLRFPNPSIESYKIDDSNGYAAFVLESYDFNCPETLRLSLPYTDQTKQSVYIDFQKYIYSDR